MVIFIGKEYPRPAGQHLRSTVSMRSRPPIVGQLAAIGLLCAACGAAEEPSRIRSSANADAAPAGAKAPIAAAPIPAPPSTAGTCVELRERFYAYQADNAACSHSNQCGCIERIDMGGALLGARTSAIPGLRALALVYSQNGCTIGGRATSVPICKARCSNGACTP